MINYADCTIIFSRENSFHHHKSREQIILMMIIWANKPLHIAARFAHVWWWCMASEDKQNIIFLPPPKMDSRLIFAQHKEHNVYRRSNFNINLWWKGLIIILHERIKLAPLSQRLVSLQPQPNRQQLSKVNEKLLLARLLSFSCSPACFTIYSWSHNGNNGRLVWVRCESVLMFILAV